MTLTLTFLHPVNRGNVVGVHHVDVLHGVVLHVLLYGVLHVAFGGNDESRGEHHGLFDDLYVEI